MKKETKTTVVLACLLVFFSAGSRADTQIHYEDGTIVNLPVGWEAKIVPKGYNTGPFDLVSNPTGKGKGFAGWPLLRPICDQLYAEPPFSPVPIGWETCNSTPTFLTTSVPVYDFYDGDSDGVIDWGSRTGCSYDPFTPTAGRAYDCS